jgi:hypothetical protein
MFYVIHLLRPPVSGQQNIQTHRLIAATLTTVSCGRMCLVASVEFIDYLYTSRGRFGQPEKTVVGVSLRGHPILGVSYEAYCGSPGHLHPRENRLLFAG